LGEHILHRQWHASQGAEGLTRCHSVVNGTRLLERAIAVHMQERVNAIIDGFDAVKVCLSDFNGTDFTSSD
jgi:hypothetical protein